MSRYGSVLEAFALGRSGRLKLRPGVATREYLGNRLTQRHRDSSLPVQPRRRSDLRALITPPVRPNSHAAATGRATEPDSALLAQCPQPRRHCSNPVAVLLEPALQSGFRHVKGPYGEAIAQRHSARLELRAQQPRPSGRLLAGACPRGLTCRPAPGNGKSSPWDSPSAALIRP